MSARSGSSASRRPTAAKVVKLIEDLPQGDVWDGEFHQCLNERLILTTTWDDVGETFDVVATFGRDALADSSA